MELPSRLRAAIEEIAVPRPPAELRRAGETLSARYRAETRDGRAHLSDAVSAEAYVVARMPATYAAIRECLAQIEATQPDFAPLSLLDVGAGPGTALWAAADALPSLSQATLVEASPAIRALGERLAAGAFAFTPHFLAADAVRGLEDAPSADLVTLSYVLDEIEPAQIPLLIDRLWQRTGGILLIVEPGTPAGWRRILAVRSQLLDAGAHAVAPCAHALACPVAGPDWCHFARRLPRSRLHRTIKGGAAPFEDEKFIYFAAARRPASRPEARILAMPRAASGRVTLKLCRHDGVLEQRLVTKRDGEAFRTARRKIWGDGL